MHRVSTFIIAATYFAAALACGSGQLLCNGQCYSPSSNSCPVDAATNKPMLCTLNYSACNGACYNPSQYHCANGQLAGGPAPAASTNTPTPSTSAAPSPVVSPAPAPAPAPAPTTSSQAAPAPTPSTYNAPAPAPTPATSSQAAAAPSCNSAGCPSGLCNCNGACYSPSQYNCATDGYTGKSVLCSGNLAACNGNCYSTTSYSCVNGQLAQVQQQQQQPQTSSAAAQPTPSTSAAPAPVVNPTPAPAGPRPTQTADLRIINSCKSTLWFEARYGGAGAPIPGQSVTATQALPGGYVDYTIPSTGLGGSRFWAKYGCDQNGKNCAVGDQMQYWPNPPGGCPANGCTPPVDSLFEATWGCPPGAGCNAQNPTTWFDTSQVDGWTIPYKLTPVGDTSGCDCVGSQCGFSGVDASRLDLANCPRSEDLSYNGQYPNATVSGLTVPLNSVDLRIIKNNQVIGCMSPCKRLNWGTPYGLQQPESSGSTMWMCCPTPTPQSCSPSNGCISPNACRAGPIVNTQYVNAVHTMAPGIYSYSYDDGVGLHACPAGVVKYTMEFCPTGSTNYPLQL